MKKMLKTHRGLVSALALEKVLAKIGRRPAPAYTEQELYEDMKMRPGRSTPVRFIKPGSRDDSPDRISMSGIDTSGKRESVSAGRPRATVLNPNGRDESSIRSIYLFQSSGPMYAFSLLRKYAYDNAVTKSSAFTNAIALYFALHKAQSRYNRDMLLRSGYKRICYNPQRLVRSCFDKMIRASGLNMEKAW